MALTASDTSKLTAALRVLVANAAGWLDDDAAEAFDSAEDHKEFVDSTAEAERILALLEAEDRDYIPVLKSLELTSALWWFIENIDDETPRRADYYWHLRERMAGYVHSDEEALRKMVRTLGQIVYTQNGNRHADINKLLDDAKLLLGDRAMPLFDLNVG